MSRRMLEQLAEPLASPQVYFASSPIPADRRRQVGASRELAGVWIAICTLSSLPLNPLAFAYGLSANVKPASRNRH
jgi:hypothetical protein